MVDGGETRPRRWRVGLETGMRRNPPLHGGLGYQLWSMVGTKADVWRQGIEIGV